MSEHNSNSEANIGFKVIVLICVMFVLFWGEPDLLDSLITFLNGIVNCNR